MRSGGFVVVLSVCGAAAPLHADHVADLDGATIARRSARAAETPSATKRGATSTFVNWESPQVHPLDLTPDGTRLLAVNTADNRLDDADDEFFLSKQDLAALDPDLFSVGLHGHEHQRFSMMPEAWQREDIRRNQEHLRDLPGYCPILAVPFGRAPDWDGTLLRLCDEFGLDLVLGDGGLNRPADRHGPYQRIPIAGEPILAKYRHSLVGW